MQKTYAVEIRKVAMKFIAKQTPAQQKRILRAIYALPDGDTKRMEGTAANHYRLRVGDYRILYEIHENILLIVVVNAGNRGDVYK